MSGSTGIRTVDLRIPSRVWVGLTASHDVSVQPSNRFFDGILYKPHEHIRNRSFVSRHPDRTCMQHTGHGPGIGIHVTQIRNEAIGHVIQPGTPGADFAHQPRSRSDDQDAQRGLSGQLLHPNRPCPACRTGTAGPRSGRWNPRPRRRCQALPAARWWRPHIGCTNQIY